MASFTFFRTSTNPKCHLTISLATSCQYQCVCKISSQYSSQFKSHFHFFGKASTNKKCQFSISWARSCQYQCLRKSLSKYSTQFKRQGQFHFFRIWHSAKPRPMINVILQFLGLDLFNITLSAKFYQNIPNGLRVKFHFFQNLILGKTSTNPKCHLTISLVTFCQDQYVCKISSQYSTQFKR